MVTNASEPCLTLTTFPAALILPAWHSSRNLHARPSLLNFVR